MKTRAREGLAAFALFVLPSFAFASSGTEGAAFLDIPVGAGPASLGSSYSALATDAYAPVYNPAGLASLSAPELSAQYLSYLESMNYEFGSFVIPLGKKDPELPATESSAGPPSRSGGRTQHSGLGVAVQYLGSGDINGTSPTGQANGSYSSYYAAYSLSYGQQVIDKLSLGLTGKAITGKIADVSATAYAADLGALYNVDQKLAFSATVNNLGTGMKFVNQDDSLPMAYHVGAAYRLNRNFSTTAEGVYNKTGLFAGRFGTEWTPMEAISLRAGYKSDTTKELSALAGFTVGIGLHVFGQEFAYAWLPYGDLGNTNYFSLLIRFGQTEEPKRNLIRYHENKETRSVRRDESVNQEPDIQQLIDMPKERS